MTAPLTPERLAEVGARADDAQQAFLTGTVGAPPNTEGLSKDDAIDVLGSSAADVPDLLDAVERLTERAERAEGALARVEALSWSLSPADGPRVREAMEGKP